MGKNHDIVEILGKVNMEKDKAYWFQAEDSELPVWLPKSQCEWDPEEGIMQMPEWLAVEKELI